MYVQSLCSGSSGNSLLVIAGETRLLIDCGIGPRSLQQVLLEQRTSIQELDAVLLTHEHDDHVRGLHGVMRHRIPVYATEGTGRAAGLPDAARRSVPIDAEFEIGRLSVRLLATSHDAEQPCGFSVSDGATRVTLLTDLGVTNESHAETVASSNLLVIEANHDVHMLKSGPYPQHLKRRVLSETGHLSNADCGIFLNHALAGPSSCATVWLAHLSATNNRPELAVRTVQQALTSVRVRPTIRALPRRELGPVWTPGALPAAAQLGLFDRVG